MNIIKKDTLDTEQKCISCNGLGMKSEAEESNVTFLSPCLQPIGVHWCSFCGGTGLMPRLCIEDSDTYYMSSDEVNVLVKALLASSKIVRNITINGISHDTTQATLSYQDIVNIAFSNNNGITDYTVTFHNMIQAGHILPNDYIDVIEGTVIHVINYKRDSHV